MTEQQYRIIEDYLQMVGKNLDERIRDEVIEELRGYIMDMALDNQTRELSDDRIWKILGQFGAPSEVASQYSQNESIEPEKLQKKDSQILMIPPISMRYTVIMIITTFLTPFLVIPSSRDGFYIISILMTWNIGSEVTLHPQSLVIGLMTGFPNILLLIQYIRYLMEKTSIRRLLIAGVFSLIIPFISFFGFLFSSYENLSGPVPLQLAIMILTLYLDKKIVIGEMIDSSQISGN